MDHNPRGSSQAHQQRRNPPLLGPDDKDILEVIRDLQIRLTRLESKINTS